MSKVRFLTSDGVKLILNAIKEKYTKKEYIEENYTKTSDLATVAITGNYADLKGDIPSATVNNATRTKAGIVKPSGVISVKNGAIDISISENCGLSNSGNSLFLNTNYGMSVISNSVCSNNPTILVSGGTWVDILNGVINIVKEYYQLGRFDDIHIIVNNKTASANGVFTIYVPFDNMSDFDTVLKSIEECIGISGIDLSNFKISGCCESEEEIRAYEELKFVSSSNVFDAFGLTLYNYVLSNSVLGNVATYVKSMLGKDLYDEIKFVETDDTRKSNFYSSISYSIPETTSTSFRYNSTKNTFLPYIITDDSSLFTVSTTVVSGNGTAVIVTSTGETGSIKVESGTSITIKATPDSGWEFVSWNDESTDAERTVTITESSVFGATFKKITTCTITVSSDDTAMGTVGVNPTDGVVTYGSNAKIFATPNTGYHFTQWNDGSTIQNRTLSNVTADKTYTAYFEQDAVVYKITTSSNNTEYGEVLIDGKSSYSVESGKSFTVTINSKDNSRFVMVTDSTGNNVSKGITDSSFELTAEKNANYSAYFCKDDTYKLLNCECDREMGSVCINKKDGTSVTSVEFSDISEIKENYTTIVANVNSEDYEFVCWNLNGEEFGKELTIDISNIELKLEDYFFVPIFKIHEAE